MESSVVYQFAKFIEDWAPKEASIAIAGGDKYITYIRGNHDIRLKQGQSIPSGSITERVYQHRRKVESFVDKDVFGVPYYGIGYPLEDEEVGFKGALTVILPPDYPLKKPEALSYIVGRRDDLWIPLPVEEIIYIESYQKKTFIYTKEGSYSCKDTLKTLEQRLSNSFIRIHRSFIVNVAYIKQISRDMASNLEVTMKDPENTSLAISQSYVQKVRRMMGF